VSDILVYLTPLTDIADVVIENVRGDRKNKVVRTAIQRGMKTLKAA
jgi:hypothetical protein